MRTMTATEASRKFSDLLDAVEAGETVEIVRGGRTVAVVGPPTTGTVGSLRAALAGLPPLDEDFEKDIASAMEYVDDEWKNPWDEA